VSVARKRTEKPPVNDEEGDGDRENAVAERVDALCALVVLSAVAPGTMPSPPMAL
jgi:hypothetical protein